MFCGEGLIEQVVVDFGLFFGVLVVVGMIDVYVGGIGMVGVGQGVISNFVYVFGIFFCMMIMMCELVFVFGVWGFYYFVMVFGFWLNEGGQSVVGVVIDQFFFFYLVVDEVKLLVKLKGVVLLVLLVDMVIEKVKFVL